MQMCLFKQIRKCKNTVKKHKWGVCKLIIHLIGMHTHAYIPFVICYHDIKYL